MTPIKTIQPFIDLDFHTVPLNGKQIARDAKGKKHGVSFPSNWQKQFSEDVNGLAVPIGGLLTGKDELVAIDCDDEKTYRLFKQLDPTNTAFMDSIGKLDKDLNPIECGTILYKHSDDIPPSFRTNNGYDLDFYNGSGMVFLPTQANETKTSWLEDEEFDLFNHNGQPVVFKAMPKEVIDLLLLLKHQPEPAKAVAQTGVATKKNGFLGKILPDLITGKNMDKYHPIITKVLTPREYRSPKYDKQGHLHPNDIVGSGWMYLFKIGCILASDNTVDKELFRDTLDYINNLWDDPEDNKKLEKSLKAPILSGRQTNDNGEPYWEYDEAWEDRMGFSVISKRDGHLLELFYDDRKQLQYLYDTAQEDVVYISPDSNKTVKHLKLISGKLNQADLEDYSEVIHTHTKPNKDYGYYNDGKDFNLFKASKPLKILNDPTIHAGEYKVPTEFISYMEHFIPAEEQRVYLLRLIRTKLTTFKYSPVVPYIIGVQGSGKNALLSILAQFIGKQYVQSNVDGTMFIQPYNGWLMDKYFVQLNELSETLTKHADKTMALGLLKNYTGADEFEVRQMRTDYYTSPQTAMFIMTANHNPLPIEDNDRRIYYISTPNTFDHSPQCLASNPPAIFNAIMKQIEDIAYWIATTYKNLQAAEYIRAPESADKKVMVFKNQLPSVKIPSALANAEFDLLMEHLINPMPLFFNAGTGRITLKGLVEAYLGETHHDKPEQVMKQAMRSFGFKAHFGSHNEPYYIIPHLEDYDGVPSDDEAEDIDLEEQRV